MARSGAKERIAWLHEHIQCGSYPNAPRLAEQFSVSLRQATRDIERLRKELGAPVVYDPAKRGFRYDSPYTLPDSVRPNDSENIAAAVAVSEFGEDGGVQLMIPYEAEIELYDKMTRLELGKFITKRGRGANRYICEFRNPDFFVGMLAATGKKIRIVSPEWLREKLVSTCNALLEANDKK